jgi:hypothetical protein
MKTLISLIRSPEANWNEVNGYEARRSTNATVANMRAKLINR